MCKFDRTSQKYKIGRMSKVGKTDKYKAIYKEYPSAREILDLPIRSLHDIVELINRMIYVSYELNLLKVAIVDMLYSPTGSGVPRQPMGVHDPITGWSYNHIVRRYYVDRTTAGVTILDNEDFMFLSRFELANLLCHPVRNLTECPEPMVLTKLLNEIFQQDLRAIFDNEILREQAKQDISKKKDVKKDEQAPKGSSKRKKHTAADTEMGKRSKKSKPTSPAHKPEALTAHTSVRPFGIIDWGVKSDTGSFYILRRDGSRQLFACIDRVLTLPRVDLDEMLEIAQSSTEAKPGQYNHLVSIFNIILSSANPAPGAPISSTDPIRELSYDPASRTFKITRSVNGVTIYQEPSIFGLPHTDIAELAEINLDYPLGDTFGRLVETTFRNMVKHFK